MSSDGGALSAGRSVSQPAAPRAASQSRSTSRAAASGQLPTAPTSCRASQHSTSSRVGNDAAAFSSSSVVPRISALRNSAEPSGVRAIASPARMVMPSPASRSTTQASREAAGSSSAWSSSAGPGIPVSCDRTGTAGRSISSFTSSGAGSGSPVRRRAPDSASRPTTASAARWSSASPCRLAQSRSGAASRLKRAMLLTQAA